MSSNPMNSWSVDREPISVESQKRGWMKEELKKAKCIQCGTVGHLYCTNDHLIQCKEDNIYKGEGFFGTMSNQMQGSPNGQVNQGIMGGYNSLGGLFGGGGYDYYGNFNRMNGGSPSTNMSMNNTNPNMSLSARLSHSNM
jgi:hypothetical protein